MRFITATKIKKEAGQAWEEVRKTRNKVWGEENPKNVVKVNHLQARAKDCDKHSMYKELDALWAKRAREPGTWSLRNTEQSQPKENDNPPPRTKKNQPPNESTTPTTTPKSKQVHSQPNPQNPGAQENILQPIPQIPGAQDVAPMTTTQPLKSQEDPNPPPPPTTTNPTHYIGHWSSRCCSSDANPSP